MCSTVYQGAYQEVKRRTSQKPVIPVISAPPRHTGRLSVSAEALPLAEVLTQLRSGCKRDRDEPGAARRPAGFNPNTKTGKVSSLPNVWNQAEECALTWNALVMSDNIVSLDLGQCSHDKECVYF